MSFWGFQGHIYVTGLLGHVPYVLVVLTLKEGPGGRNGDIPSNKRGTLLRASPLFPLASPSCVPNPSHTPVGAHKRRRLGQWGACYGPLPFCPWLLFQPLQRICILATPSSRQTIIPVLHLFDRSSSVSAAGCIWLLWWGDQFGNYCNFNFIWWDGFKVAGKQKIGSLTVLFSRCVHKKSYVFIYNVAMALLYTFLS